MPFSLFDCSVVFTILFTHVLYTLTEKNKTKDLEEKQNAGGTLLNSANAL